MNIMTRHIIYADEWEWNDDIHMYINEMTGEQWDEDTFEQQYIVG